ncbi:unnamed protein product [Blepharisma stoltei]|uniref:Uncharacterized protein n=1 Tax=Blepharisma stoltei TaxID=1481888 RepID=A0AAU9IP23_9CILI|nr:unnamed protein product [Blepharisma stoltei]
MGEPREFQAVTKILNSMVDSYSEDVPFLLHEFFDRYIHEILSGAKIHADRRNDTIQPRDIKVSIDFRTKFAFKTRMSKPELQNLAEQRNKIKLPIPGDRTGILLPSEEHCLLSKNYQLIRDHDMNLDF